MPLPNPKNMTVSPALVDLGLGQQVVEQLALEQEALRKKNRGVDARSSQAAMDLFGGQP